MTEEKETPEEKAEGPAPEEATEAEAEATPKEAVAKAAGAEEAERYSRAQLQRLTTKKLREIALELAQITGVHGMKKDELVESIFALKGLEEAEDAQEVSVDKTALKSEIRDLKAMRDSALQAGDAVQLKRVRNRIKRLKRALRRAS